MAEKITRQTQKIFAGNAPIDSLAQFGSMITGNPIYTDSIEDLQSNAYQEGWAPAIAANEAPFLEEMNGVQYGFSKQLAYIFQQGIPEYDPGTLYYIGSLVVVIDIEGNPTVYRSIIDNNINNPVTDTNCWIVYQQVNGVFYQVIGEVEITIPDPPQSEPNDWLYKVIDPPEANPESNEWSYQVVDPPEEIKPEEAKKWNYKEIE